MGQHMLKTFPILFRREREREREREGEREGERERVNAYSQV